MFARDPISRIERNPPHRHNIYRTALVDLVDLVVDDDAADADADGLVKKEKRRVRRRGEKKDKVERMTRLSSQRNTRTFCRPVRRPPSLFRPEKPAAIY